MESSITKKLAQLTARKYEIEDTIAHGGMGEILEAKDLTIKRTVAMKMLLANREKTPDVLLRFIEEAQITGQLEHPGIVPVHELGFNDRNEIFYTMKYVKGVTLKEIIRKIRAGDAETITNYPLSRLLTIFQKVCDAVAYAHSKGVIHRDLKSENIMIGDFGEVLTLDWGLAKIKEYSLHNGLQTLRSDVIIDLNTDMDGGDPTADPKTTQSEQDHPDQSQDVDTQNGDNIHTLKGMQTIDGKILGTPNYMSPEQATGQNDAIDHRSDIYALGGILYHMLTLCPPITGKSFTEMMINIVKGNILPPTAFQSKVKKTYGITPFSRFNDALADEELAPEDLIDKMVFAHCPGNKIPESLSAVAMKALARQPARRYQSVGALQREIQAYQEGFATTAEDAGLPKQILLLIKRNKTVAIISAVSIMTFIAMIVVFVAKVEEKNLELQQTAAVLETQNKLLERKEDEIQQSWEKLQFEHVRVEQERRGKEVERLAKEEERRAREREMQLKIEEKILRTKEQYAREQVSKLSAPEFVNKALGLAEAGDWDEAVRTIQIAIELDDSLEEAWLLSGRLFLGSLRFDEARSAFARTRQPDHLGITALFDTYQPRRDKSTGKLNLTDLRLLRRHCQELNDTLLSSHFKLMEITAEKDLSIQIAASKNMLFSSNPGLKSIRCDWGVDEEKIFLDLSGNQELRELKGIANLPLTELHLQNTGVTDITVLKDMPLAVLSISHRVEKGWEVIPTLPLVDLHVHGPPYQDLKSLLNGAAIHLHLHLADHEFNPIAFPDIVRHIDPGATHLYLHGPGIMSVYFLFNIPFQELSLVGTQVEDLETLIATPLRVLDLANAPIKNLKILRGKPITHLNLDRTQVRDISPLADMPIVNLSLAETKIKNLDVLTGMPLKVLNVGNTSITDFSILWPLPLTDLSLAGLPIIEVNFLKGKALQTLDISGTVVSDLSPLIGMPLKSLDISRTRVGNGSALTALPLRKLRFNKTAIVDLAFVRQMSLRYLEFDQTMVKDLAPLRGLPIAHLSLAETAVKDLTPLADLPLVELSLRGCTQIISLAPLARCQQLRRLILPATATADIESLKSLPDLEFIATSGELGAMTQTAAQFWEKYLSTPVQP